MEEELREEEINSYFRGDFDSLYLSSVILAVQAHIFENSRG
jgi:hypothetical protein